MDGTRPNDPLFQTSAPRQYLFAAKGVRKAWDPPKLGSAKVYVPADAVPVWKLIRFDSGSFCDNYFYYISIFSPSILPSRRNSSAK